jgi:hypothetical protein
VVAEDREPGSFSVSRRNSVACRNGESSIWKAYPAVPKPQRKLHKCIYLQAKYLLAGFR